MKLLIFPSTDGPTCCALYPEEWHEDDARKLAEAAFLAAQQAVQRNRIGYEREMKARGLTVVGWFGFGRSKESR